MPLQTTLNSMPVGGGGAQMQALRMCNMMSDMTRQLMSFMGQQEAVEKQLSQQGAQLSEQGAQLQAQKARLTALEREATQQGTQLQEVRKTTDGHAAALETVARHSVYSQQKIDAFFGALDQARGVPPLPFPLPAPRPGGGGASQIGTAPPPEPVPGQKRKHADADAPRPWVEDVAMAAEPAAGPLIDRLTPEQLEASRREIEAYFAQVGRRCFATSKKLHEPMLRLSREGQAVELQESEGRCTVFIFAQLTSQHGPPRVRQRLSRPTLRSPFTAYAARCHSVPDAVRYREHVLDKLGYRVRMMDGGKRYEVLRV